MASDAILLATRALGARRRAGRRRARAAGPWSSGAGRNDAAAHFAAALDDFTAARDAARRAGDRRLQMTVLRELAGDVPVALGRPPADCEPVLAECLRLAGALGDRGMEADVLGRLTVLRVLAARLRRRPGAGPPRPGRRSRGRGRARVRPRPGRGEDRLRLPRPRSTSWRPSIDELKPCCAAPATSGRCSGRSSRARSCPLAAGDDAAALDRIEAALEVCRRSGYTAYEPFFIAHLGWVHRLAGRLDVARREGRRAAELAERHRHTWWSTTAASLYAGTLLACGEPAAAAAVLRPAARVADVPGAEAYLLRCLGPLAEATGDADVLQRADALLRGIRAPEGCAWLLGADAYLGVARAWRRAGDPDRADRILTGFRAAARAAGWAVLEARRLTEPAARFLQRPAPSSRRPIHHEQGERRWRSTTTS